MSYRGNKQNRAPRACDCGAHGFIGFKTWHIALFDADRIPELSGYSWTMSHPERRDCYAYDAKRRVMMHRLLAGVHGVTGPWVDHANGDTLDNRSSNIRACTPAQNCKNKRKRKGSSSQFKGVYWGGKSWTADIQGDGLRVRKHGFNAEIDAAIFYDAAAIQMHGEFARTNASLGLLPAVAVATLPNAMKHLGRKP